MKRANNLFEQITDFNNLRLAYLKALKGKRFTPAAIIFDKNADENLYRIKASLENQTYKIGKYRQFKIFDPKERLITAATFEDRIVHHAIMNILEPVFEKQFIFHTYACRKNKGTHKAIDYVLQKSRNNRYFLKLDIRKYFDSIAHNKLKILLNRIIKDKNCLNLLFEIINSYNVLTLENVNAKGLPIGNLTSQFFANFYLSGLDHFVLEHLKPSGYVRYMDDIIVFSNSKSNLKEIYKKMKDHISNFGLEFKQPVINSCRGGIPFLGYLIYDNKLKLLNKNKKRRQNRLRKLTRDFEKEIISAEEYAIRLG